MYGKEILMRLSRGLRYAMPFVFLAQFAFAQSDVDRRVQQLESDLRETRGELSETRGQLQQLLQEIRDLRQQIGARASAATAAPAPAGTADYAAPTAPPPGQSI